MEAVLDFSRPLDVGLLDKVVVCMNTPSDRQRSQADKVLTAFKQHNDAWMRVDSILDNQQCSQLTKFFALQILEQVVKYRWRSLPADERQQIKNYTVSKIVMWSSDDATLRREELLVNRMNLILVGILKHEWPSQWPGFITEIVTASKQSEVLCENNVRILKLLSEEVFDYSKGSITAQKTDALKSSLTGEFEQIFHLCEFILQVSARQSLINETLSTLQRFVTWIPDKYIFETAILPTLCARFLPAPQFRVNTLQVLTEVGSLAKPAYNHVFLELYKAVMTQLVRVLPAHLSVPQLYAKGNAQDQLFIRHLALFMCGFLKAHASLLETPEMLALLMSGMDYLVKISDIDDMEVLKICLDYWQILANDLYSQQAQYQPAMPSLPGAMDGTGQQMGMQSAWGQPQPALAPPVNPRKMLYADLLSRVRDVLINHMQKPEEVLVEADENGDIVREQTKDTEALAVYKIMKDTLVYLTHLDPVDTEKLMLTKLEKQMEQTNETFKYEDLNTLCWAIGSISGAMSEGAEKRFLVTVIKELLSLVEKLKGKNFKAVVASNIMYVVGQYPRFLRAHWKFLKTVILKLFEFMHERHPGVQDMAVDTFLKIAQKCKKKFVQVQPGENTMFFAEICRMIPSIIADLDAHQVHTFYEACGVFISAHPEDEEKKNMTTELMQLVNNVWRTTITNAAANVSVLHNPAVVKELGRVLRTNMHVCRAVGASFAAQLGSIYLDMLQMYSLLSKLIGQAIASSGPAVVGSDAIKAMRSCKKEVLVMVSTFVTLPDIDADFIAKGFMPPFLTPVLEDYRTAHPSVRQAEVLDCLSEIVNRLQGHIAEQCPAILEAVFEPTLSMITANFEDFPEHRMNFFKLIEAVNAYCFPAIFQIPAAHQRMLVEAIVWAFRHTARDIGETGLTILEKLIQNVASAASADPTGRMSAELSQPFWSQYFLSIVEVLMGVLTDRLHKAHFKQHATILQQMFSLLERGQITTPLWESPSAVSNGSTARFRSKLEAAAAAVGSVVPPPGAVSNQQFVREYVRGLISTNFPTLKQSQVSTFIEGLFDMTRDLKSYKSLLRDFLIEVLEFGGDEDAPSAFAAAAGAVPGVSSSAAHPGTDDGDLYAEERTAAAAAQAAADAARRAAVPGLLNPYQQVAADDDEL